ncbi:MAG: DUF547 domain-containing protein [Mariprofundaceae bacterium]|nr:DUF547 domain-containing protein [Mariprofundaceae bacterium]
MRLLSLCILLFYPILAQSHDFSSWNGLLKDYIHTGNKHAIQLNVVNYQSLQQDARWHQTLNELKQAHVKTLLTKQDKLAFWINSYNILAVKIVVEHAGIQSIKDAGRWYTPIWKEDAGMVAGKVYSLNDIENNILRPMGEPRIHFAIVCASVSCPDLRDEAYQADRLDGQLNEQVHRFLANQGKGARLHQGKLEVSSIFKWFADDFEHVGGVIAFMQKYSTIKSHPIDGYLDYDWSLNASQ